ncbi:MAG: S8 family peptidase [Elusimicrobia bacterium]|nr:S8 family peptidase [Elusimicrobiota bacterium]
MRKTILFAAVVFAACILAGAQAIADTSESQALAKVPKQKIVVFDDPRLTWEQKEEMIRQAGGEPVRRLVSINAVVGYFPRGMALNLDDQPQISLVADDDYAQMIVGEAAPLFAPAVPPKAQQTPWGVERIGSSYAWRQAQGRGVKVCIIDSGVDVTHPDLAGNVMGGANFAESTGTPTTNIEDELGHGTHVNGIIAAMDNATGLVGVAPHATLYQSKVFGSSGYTSWSTIMAGIEYCASIGAQVINMSLGGSRNNAALHLAVQKAHQQGIVIVAAAGNDYGRPVAFPGAYPEVVGVSASNINNALAGFSSKGPEVDLIAPGDDILSTYKGGQYREMSGTSMASPHVAGVAALILSRNNTLSNVQVQQIMERTAMTLGLAPEAQGRGLVNARAAVVEASMSAHDRLMADTPSGTATMPSVQGPIRIRVPTTLSGIPRRPANPQQGLQQVRTIFGN